MALTGAKRILALKKRKARDRERAFLIEGVRLCEEALRSGSAEQLIFARDMLDGNPRLSALKAAAEAAGIPVQLTDRRALKGMCDTDAPQGVLGVAPFAGHSRDGVLACGRPLLVLDRVRDPGNVGLILRTAEAAGAGGVFLLSGSVELYNEKVVRATMGSIFRLPVFEDENAPAVVADLKAAGVTLVAAAADGTPYRQVALPSARALILGNEAFGVDPALVAAADRTVSIPMAAPVESLNVAIAAAILLYAG
jgi:TrmH family RNA methyltransferase